MSAYSASWVGAMSPGFVGLCAPSCACDHQPVDEQEARVVLGRRVSELRELRYDEILDRFLLDEPLRREPTWEEARGGSGTTYWLKIYAYWDSDARDDIRVFVDVDDGTKPGSGARSATISSSLPTDRSSVSS